MPTYDYYQCGEVDGYTEERNVPISERDSQVCKRCGFPVERKITFRGLTWAPTAGGMR